MTNQNDYTPDRDDFVHMQIGKAGSKVTRANFVNGFLNDVAAQQDGTAAALIASSAIDFTINARTIYRVKADAVADTIPAAIQVLTTQGYTTVGLGGARYLRTSLVAITAGSYPAASYFRSADRYMPDGSTNSTNGGYWLLMEKAVRPEMLGAVGDGSTNDTVAVQAAFTYGAAEIIADLVYKVNSAVTATAWSGHLRGKGTFDCSAGGSINITGSVTQVGDMSGNVSIGGRTLPFSSVSGISAFDDLIIYDPTDYSFSNSRTYYRAGEFVSVATISGTTVTLAGELLDSYVAATVDVYRLNPVRVQVSDLKFIEATSGSVAPLKISFGADCSVSRVQFRSSFYAGLLFDRCVRTTVDNTNGKNNSPASGYDYGIVLSNCQDWTINGGSFMATRHGIAPGGNDVICCVPTSHGKVIGATLRSSASAASADMHGNCRLVQYINCDIYESGTIGGQDVTYKGCQFWGRSSADGAAIVLTEVRGGDIKLLDCTIYSNGDGSSFGYIDWVVNDLPKATTTIHIRNLHVRGLTPSSGGGAGAKVLHIIQTATSSTQKVNVDMRGVRVDYAECQAFLYCTNNAAASFYSDGLIVDDLVGPAFTYIIYPDADIAAVPTREMSQRGRAYKTTTAAASAIATAQTYNLRYSRQPRASAVGLSIDGGGASLTLAGKTPIPIVYEVTNLAITPAMVSSDGAAFTASAYIAMDWEVGIKDI